MSVVTKIVTRVFGKKSDKDMKLVSPMVDSINEIYHTLISLSDDELKQRLQDHKTELENRRQTARKSAEDRKLKGSQLDEEIYRAEQDYLNEAMFDVFAIVKDASRRLVGTSFHGMGNEMTWEMVHFDGQLIGGIVLHQGKIAEM